MCVWVTVRPKHRHACQLHQMYFFIDQHLVSISPLGKRVRLLMRFITTSEFWRRDGVKWTPLCANVEFIATPMRNIRWQQICSLFVRDWKNFSTKEENEYGSKTRSTTGLVTGLVTGSITGSLLFRLLLKSDHVVDSQNGDGCLCCKLKPTVANKQDEGGEEWVPRKQLLNPLWTSKQSKLTFI